MKFIIRVLTILPILALWTVGSLVIIPVCGIMDIMYWAWGDNHNFVTPNWMRMPIILLKSIRTGGI